MPSQVDATAYSPRWNLSRMIPSCDVGCDSYLYSFNLREVSKIKHGSETIIKAQNLIMNFKCSYGTSSMFSVWSQYDRIYYNYNINIVVDLSVYIVILIHVCMLGLICSNTKYNEVSSSLQIYKFSIPKF